jgi:hypothetical protein
MLGLAPTTPGGLTGSAPSESDSNWSDFFKLAFGAVGPTLAAVLADGADGAAASFDSWQLLDELESIKKKTFWPKFTEQY